MSMFVTSDGAIWFTDPHYGIMTDYEGFRAEQELPRAVYRVSLDSKIEAVITDMACPNGLAFSPDESRLYVADTGRMFSSDPQEIRSSTLLPAGPLKVDISTRFLRELRMVCALIAMATFGHQQPTVCTALLQTGT
jgi:sugar lactone lactonase YvrE